MSQDRVSLNAGRLEWAAGAANLCPKFSMTAYTGAVVGVGGWDNPVIVDLEGMKIPDTVMIRYGHNGMVGHGTAEVKNGKVVAEGKLSFVNQDAMNIAAAAKNDFPWQASIGANVITRETLTAGQQASVNGINVTGPIDIVRQSFLDEISFVERGADGATSAQVAAKAKEKTVSEQKPADVKPADSPELMLARVEAEKAELVAMQLRSRRKSVRAMCPRGLESEADGMILDVKLTVDQIRTNLAELAAKRGQPTGHNEPAPITKTGTDPEAEAGKKVLASKDEDFAKLFGA